MPNTKEGRGKNYRKISQERPSNYLLYGDTPMKRLLILCCALCLLGVLTGSSNAAVIDIPNNTIVQSWSGFNSNTNTPLGPVAYNNPNGNVNSPTNTWHDVIGAIGDFETFGATYDTATKELKIKTNWGGDAFTTLGAKTADLFLDFDANGAWDVAIGLRSGTGTDDRLNYVYSGNLTWYTSQDWNNYYFPQKPSAIYGGQYGGVESGTRPNATVDENYAKPVPVEAKTYDSSTKIDNLVSWTNTSGGDPWYAAINLGLLSSYGFDPENFGLAFLWATGTCANDTAEGGLAPTGVVPLPPSVLLLGSGLLGLGLLGFRRRKRGL